MLKKFSLLSLILLILFITGCNNEKGNNIYIGVEGENVKVTSVGEYSRDDQLTLISNLYSGLFEYSDTEGIVPVLAQSFHYSEDSKKIYIKIKDNVFWSDGEALSPEDAAEGLKNNLRSQEGRYSYQQKYFDLKSEENIKVNEDGLLEIALSREFPDFEKVLAMPIFYPVLNAADPLLGPFSGEFIVEKNAGDKITLVTRDMEKAAAEKKTEKIIFEYSLNKEKIIKGFQNKEYDIIFSDNLQGEIKGQNITAPGYNLLWLNSRSEELKNAEARKAIFQSIDKKAAPQLDIKSEYSFTNSKLRMLIPEKPEAEKTAGKIADQISKKTGLEIEIISKNTEDYFKDLRGGNFDLALEAWESDYHGRNSFFEVFKNPIYNPLNVSGLIVPEINDLQNKINKIVDSPEREELFNELERKIHESISAIVLSEGIEKEVYIQRVKNILINPIYNYHDYSNVKY